MVASTRWRDLARSAVGRFPALYLFVQRQRDARRLARLGRTQARAAVLAPDTDIVIEGFPRSANSWSVRVFRLWQAGRVKIAHHQHHEAHVIAACWQGVPVLVLVRDPADAIRSFAQMEPDLDPARALERWIVFHEAVEPLAQRIVFATFDQAISDLGAVVERVNARFGTRFAHGATDAKLFDQVTSRMAEATRPRPERRSALADITPALDANRLAHARALFDRLSALAVIEPAVPNG